MKSDELKACREAFESVYEVPDFIEFDGEDYMYYGEDPVLREECENIHRRWDGFTEGWKSTQTEAVRAVVERIEKENNIYNELTGELIGCREIKVRKELNKIREKLEAGE